MAAQPDTLAVTRGSTDWTGNVAPAGGTHTGSATIVMVSGASYSVASNRSEILRKLSTVVAPPSSALIPWIAFDQPGAGLPVILNANNIASVK
jgi:hypothetical protein